MPKHMEDTFRRIDESFADILMLRYRLDGLGELSARRKELVYSLSQAALFGRDITFDQFGRHNLAIRSVLEAVYALWEGDRSSDGFRALETYLKRVWFSNGIYHHYGGEKFVPGFSEGFLREAVGSLPPGSVRLCGHPDLDSLLDDIVPVVFDPGVLPRKVNRRPGEDLVATSACNFYQGVTQGEVESLYAAMRSPGDDEPPSYGLNSTVVKRNGRVEEDVWRLGGRYGPAIGRILHWLGKAMDVAEGDRQRSVIGALMDHYRSGDLRDFNRYCIEWVGDTDSRVDFINGFIEVYDDPLGLKGTWEGLVEYRDEAGTERARRISSAAQWFEDNSPVDPRFRKERVCGVSASAVCAAMLGGGEYPATAIGINLPNADWIRARHGSKSVSISNITAAYNEAARGNGFLEEFVIDGATMEMIRKHGDACDSLHTDLHECLGHGSGRLLPGVDPGALGAYGNTIEEARADLFGLYYAADAKMVELGLLPDGEAYRAGYYSFMMNGLLTQLSRIGRGNRIEEAHMRDRALIARWCHERGRDDGTVELTRRDGRTYLRIGSYERLRGLFATLLAEVQRIRSEGDHAAARDLVERYAVDVDPALHEEVLERYGKLGIPPYKGFINPVLRPVLGDGGEFMDLEVDYTEGYAEQMLRYSRDYSTLT